MYRMLKGNDGNIASQPTLTKRLVEFEKHNGISKTPTPVKQSSSRSVPSASSASNEQQQQASIESALKNICNKYGIKSPRHTWMMNTADLDKFTEMSELADEVGKKFCFTKDNVDIFMFEKVIRKDGQFASIRRLIIRLNRLHYELGHDQYTKEKTPKST